MLAGWREMSVEDMKQRIWWALEDDLNRTPGTLEQLWALGTKEEIMREYGELAYVALAYVPGVIAVNAMCGAWALRQIRRVGVENLGVLDRYACFRHACRACVDFSIIRSLYESLLAVRGFAVGEGLGCAACGGHLDIIDPFVGTPGVDVDAVDWVGKTMLMQAAEYGHADTVNALAGTRNANVDAVDRLGQTALIYAHRHTDTVNAPRRHGATR